MRLLTREADAKEGRSRRGTSAHFHGAVTNDGTDRAHQRNMTDWFLYQWARPSSIKPRRHSSELLDANSTERYINRLTRVVCRKVQPQRKGPSVGY